MGIRVLAGSGAAVVLVLLSSALLGCNADPKGMATRDHDPTSSSPYVPPGSSAPQPPLTTAGSSGGAGSGPGASSAGSDAGAHDGMATDAGASHPSDGSMTDAAVDAGPILPTVCADDDAGVADEDAGARDCVVMGDLELQYKAADTNAADNAIKPHFNLVNTGKQSVDLGQITIRYWFADSDPAALVFWCDYAQIGCATIHGAFATSDRTGGDHILEVTFTSGTLAPGAATGEIQTRFNHEGWTLFDETDDYSFDPSKTTFTNWYKVTLYQRTTLIWGQEP
jgi:cellulose 1,4-beta-cellobiosidase